MRYNLVLQGRGRLADIIFSDFGWRTWCGSGGTTQGFFAPPTSLDFILDIYPAVLALLGAAFSLGD